jgi:hypothetical protein
MWLHSVAEVTSLLYSTSSCTAFPVGEILISQSNYRQSLKFKQTLKIEEQALKIGTIVVYFYSKSDFLANYFGWYAVLVF